MVGGRAKLGLIGSETKGGLGRELFYRIEHFALEGLKRSMAHNIHKDVVVGARALPCV